MKKISALIIDDEHLAREVIKSYLEQEGSIQIIGECADGFDGFKQINELRPDLVFLDIMMPKLTGFEMLELVENPPVIVFSTAYDEFAIKAFERNATDYLLKPYSKDRFLEAIAKVMEKIRKGNRTNHSMISVVEEAQEKPEKLTRVAVRNGVKIHIIGVQKISYLEAQDDYVKLYTDEGAFLKQHTMKYFETHLPSEYFHRIHRSYIVNLQEIARLELIGKDAHVAILHDGTQLSVSRSGYSSLKAVLGF